MKKLSSCGYLLLLVFISLSHGLLAQTPDPLFPGFTDVTGTLVPGVEGVDESYVVWGDYDNDNDLDFILSGMSSGVEISQIWENSSGVFVNRTATIAPGFPQVEDAHFEWGDYDNDNDPDLLVTGFPATGPGICEIWINDVNQSGMFTKAPVNVQNDVVTYSSAAWGDYDNDGDLDIVLSGAIDATHRVTRICRNNGDNTFADILADIPAISYYPSMVFGDYDNDRDLDLILRGVVVDIPNNNSTRVADIWRNDDGTFVPLHSGLTPVNGGSSNWGDYDNDGDLDILLTAYNDDYGISEIWRNDNGTFVNNVNADLPPMEHSSQWADLDNDGDLDVVVSGYTGSSGTSGVHIWKNTGGSFTFAKALANGEYGGVLHCGDFDNDHDLDILLAGGDLFRLYRNESDQVNALPSQPSSLQSQLTDQTIVLTWSTATDDHSSRLTYNIRVGTTPGGSEVISPLASVPTGKRRIPEMGNAELKTSFKLKEPGPGTYYWSVQAVDNTYEGGGFAQEQSFIVPSHDPGILAPTLISRIPVNGANNVITGTTLKLTFSENIVLNSGSIRIYNFSSNQLITAIPLTTSNTGITGTQAIITPPVSFPNGSLLYIQIDGGTFHDQAGNVFGGIQDKSWSFTTIAAVADKTAPVLVSTSPVNHSTGVNEASPLVITFSEPVVWVTGQIKAIYSENGFIVIRGIDKETSTTTILGNTVTITPRTPLPSGTTLSIRIDEGMFRDASNNVFKGINSSGIWTFTTAVAPDIAAPFIVSTIPSKEAPDVDPGTTLTLHFNEYVQLHSGQVNVLQESANFALLKVDLDASNTVIDKATVVITLPSLLPVHESLYVQISPGAITDIAGNEFPGITDRQWQFSTQKIVTGIERHPAMTGITIQAHGEHTLIRIDNSEITIRVVSDVIGRPISYSGTGNEIMLRRHSGLLLLQATNGGEPVVWKVFIKE